MSIIGIDFGTSNSLGAIIQDGQVKFVEFDGMKSTPTVLFFPELSLLSKNRSSYYFGREAIEKKYEDDDSGRLVFSFKGLLADTLFDQTVIPGYGTFTAERFCEYFIKKVKSLAEQQFSTIFDCVVLGRPVDFDEMAIARLEKAALAAGFKKIFFQMEPIAAALSYERSLPANESDKLVFVCDIGGGTSDYAIVRLSPRRAHQSDRSSDILATGGIYKAGETFNSSIMKDGLAERFGKGAKWGERGLDFPVHWISALGNWKTLSFLRKENVGGLVVHTEEGRKHDVQRLADLITHNLGYKLYSVVDKAKIQLSFQSQTVIKMSILDLHESLTKIQFEALIEDTLNEMTKEMQDTLTRAQITAEDIDSVILTGGSSEVPAVRKSIIRIFGKSKIVPIDTFNSVVAGLALEAEKYKTQCS